MPSVPILLATAGGTIDKIPGSAPGELLVGPPVAPAALSLAGFSFSGPLPILAKDSLDITPAERIVIAAAISARPETRVLLTHGTDTMSLTAKAIASLRLPKTIVLTGAMVPRSLPGSDADLNLGAAFFAASALPQGVYICMHGLALPHDQYSKNAELGRFEPIRKP